MQGERRFRAIRPDYSLLKSLDSPKQVFAYFVRKEREGRYQRKTNRRATKLETKSPRVCYMDRFCALTGCNNFVGKVHCKN